jgi:hypothetical protein
MHYSPRIWQRRGPELPLLFPLPFLPSPSVSLLPLFSPRPRGPKGPVTVASSQWPTIGYFFTLLLTMISHSLSTP